MSRCSHYYVQVVCSAHSRHSIMPGYASWGPPCPQQPSWRFLSCSNAGSVNRDRRHVNAACEVFDTSQQHPTIAVRIRASSLSACSPQWRPCPAICSRLPHQARNPLRINSGCFEVQKNAPVGSASRHFLQIISIT